MLEESPNILTSSPNTSTSLIDIVAIDIVSIKRMTFVYSDERETRAF